MIRVTYLVEMDETTESTNVREMAETDESKICEVTGSVEIAKTAGRVDDGAEVTDAADATKVTEMVDLAEQEEEGPGKKVSCQKIISASIPRVKTFYLGKTTPINVVKNFGTCGLKFPFQYRVVPAPLRLYQRPLERDKADQRLPPSIWISHFCPHGCLASFPCMVVQGNGRLFQQWLEKGPPSLIVPPGCHCGDTLLRCLCLLCGNQKDC